MLLRVLFWAGLALLGLRLFAPQRLRALGKQIDRGVNLTLIGLGLVYAVEVALWLLSR